MAAAGAYVNGTRQSEIARTNAFMKHNTWVLVSAEAIILPSLPAKEMHGEGAGAGAG